MGWLSSAHENLFENQMATIYAQPDAADAIYFMSLGKFTTTCKGKKANVEVCAGATNTTTKTYTTFGEINGITATQATVIRAASTWPPGRKRFMCI